MIDLSNLPPELCQLVTRFAPDVKAFCMLRGTSKAFRDMPEKLIEKIYTSFVTTQVVLRVDSVQSDPPYRETILTGISPNIETALSMGLELTRFSPLTNLRGCVYELPTFNVPKRVWHGDWIVYEWITCTGQTFTREEIEKKRTVTKFRFGKLVKD